VSLTSGIQINVSSKFRQIRRKPPANSIRIIQYLNPDEEPVVRCENGEDETGLRSTESIVGLTRLSSQTRRAYL
jgi:hypothetical protein